MANGSKDNNIAFINCFDVFEKTRIKNTWNNRYKKTTENPRKKQNRTKKKTANTKKTDTDKNNGKNTWELKRRKK